MTLLKKFGKLKDEEVLKRVLEGDVVLYEVIIRRYNPYLFKIGRTYGFNQQDTEDLIQETFISSYSGLSAFQNRSSLKTWLVRIMLNHCFHKKKKRDFANEVIADLMETEIRNPRMMPSVEQPVMNTELKHVLEQSLLKLPPQYRMVFTLRELNGMSTSEVAEAMEISEANVKVRLNRAKSMLRKEIEKSYTPEEIFEFNLVYCNRIVDRIFEKLPEKPSLNPDLPSIPKISWWDWLLSKLRRP